MRAREESRCEGRFSNEAIAASLEVRQLAAAAAAAAGAADASRAHACTSIAPVRAVSDLPRPCLVKEGPRQDVGSVSSHASPRIEYILGQGTVIAPATEEPMFMMGMCVSELVNGDVKQVVEDNYFALFYRYSCTCLLYTSPSPRDKRQSRIPSSA